MGRRGRARAAILFTLPAIALYTIFFILPAIQALWVSLHDWSGYGENMVYIGLGNYREMLGDNVFLGSLKRTLIISLAGGIGIFGLAIFLSATFQRKLIGRKFFRALIFFPNVIPAIGIGLIWAFVYNDNWGPLSELLQLLGLEKLDRVWLGPDFIIQSLTAAIVWTYVGFYMVILLAGIDKIPKEYYDAAVIDGASEWKMFFQITLPMIWDVLTIALILWVVASLKIFDLIAATTFPVPTTSTYTLTIYIWATALGVYAPVFRLGYATAIGVVLLLLVVVSVAIVRLVTRREAIEY